MKYGKLTPIELIEKDSRGRQRWLCRCECGEETIARMDSLKDGNTTSCGCMKGKHLWNTRTKRPNGYVWTYLPEHPSCDKRGYVPEHRLIMELVIGRYLIDGECVHHYNGIKHDNSIDNLVLFESNSAHISYHMEVLRGEH